jgi:prephenate dehydrogenase
VVATVSHVPHLTAATLMGLAARRGADDASLLRLAAGGFRDMTRVAAGDPDIWIDICSENRDAILDVLDGLLEGIADVRRVVADRRTDELRDLLHEAHVARRSLPTGAPPAEELVEVRVPIPDRSGELVAVTALAGARGINVYDVEIAHHAGVPTGLLILVVAADRAEELSTALRESGRTASVHELA